MNRENKVSIATKYKFSKNKFVDQISRGPWRLFTFIPVALNARHYNDLLFVKAVIVQNILSMRTTRYVGPDSDQEGNNSEDEADAGDEEINQKHYVEMGPNEITEMMQEQVNDGDEIQDQDDENQAIDEDEESDADKVREIQAVE